MPSRTQLTAELPKEPLCHWIWQSVSKKNLKKTSLNLMLTEMLVLLWIKFFCLMYNTKNLCLYCYIFLLLLASFPSYGISSFNLGTQETQETQTSRKTHDLCNSNVGSLESSLTKLCQSTSVPRDVLFGNSFKKDAREEVFLSHKFYPALSLPSSTSLY